MKGMTFYSLLMTALAVSSVWMTKQVSNEEIALYVAFGIIIFTLASIRFFQGVKNEK